jgi:hypothetical protein
MSARSRRAAAAAVAAVAFTAVSRAHAQVAPVNPFSFGVSAGAAIPTGEGSEGVNTGFSVDGIIGLRVPASPLSFRGEVGYTRFGVKDADGVNIRFLSGVANAVYTFSAGPTAVVRPYLIAGVGAYNGKLTVDDSDVDVDDESQTKIGLNGGVGLEIPLSGITGFGEIRYTSVATEGSRTSWIPIRFGIRF